LSDDSKKVRCNICIALCGRNNEWIQKESLSYHLKSDLHARSVRAKQNKDSIRTAAEQSLQEQGTIEERQDFAMLSSANEPAVKMQACISKPSMEEQEMWDNNAFSDEIFSAGIDHAAAAANERKRLEKEATDFDLWHGADFLPEEDPNDGQLLLDELEQNDILTELLRNTCAYTSQFHLYISMHITFWIDVDVAEGDDLLDEELRDHTSRPKSSEAWSPYTSKTVSRPSNTETND
jgi:hypothetical protein